jgi:hypothetical protein
VIEGELRAKVGDLRQFASARRIIPDDGVERGVRALAFSSGGSLESRFYGLKKLVKC